MKKRAVKNHANAKNHKHREIKNIHAIYNPCSRRHQFVFSYPSHTGSHNCALFLRLSGPTARNKGWWGGVGGGG